MNAVIITSTVIGRTSMCFYYFERVKEKKTLIFVCLSNVFHGLSSGRPFPYVILQRQVTTEVAFVTE